MNAILRFCCLIAAVSLFSCSKTVPTPAYPSYYGNWLFIGSSRGPSFTKPSPDSIVILSLKLGNNYTATLNGIPSLEGSFFIDSNANGVALEFLNITQPYGKVTTVVSNGITFLYFNTAKIGQLTLFENNATWSPGDTLVLTSYPITPEFTSNYFKRN